MSDGKIQGLTVKLGLGSQRDRPAELKSDRQKIGAEERDEENDRERREESGRAKESKRQKVIGSMMASSCMALSQTNSS